MKVNKTNNKIVKSLSAGFSLVEMLVVIAVIGVIAAIAVPNISSLTNSADVAKNKRNAQNLASVCSASQAAGWDFVEENASVEDDVVTAIVAGYTVTEGAFEDTFFGVPNMSADEQTGAKEYLSVDAGVLKYHEEGGQ